MKLLLRFNVWFWGLGLGLGLGMGWEGMQKSKAEESFQMNKARKIGTSFIHQYGCWKREGYTDEVAARTYYTRSQKKFFYYNQSSFPEDHTAKGTSPLLSSFLVCHDIFTHGEEDRPEHPRINMIPKLFRLFDPQDLYFAKGDQEGNLAINQLLKARLLYEWGVKYDENYFTPFLQLGYVLRPILDRQQNKVHCPSKEDFEGSVPLYAVLNDYLMEGTEALYMGVSLYPESIKGTTVLVPASILSGIWFDWDTKLPPEGGDLRGKRIAFYWPPYLENPTFKRSHQNTYFLTFRPLESLETLDVNDLTLHNMNQITYSKTPHDLRVACVPKANGSVEEGSGRQVGQTCTSDLQCLSGCCNNRLCYAHDTSTFNSVITCKKPAGNTCLSSDYCNTYTLRDCSIIRTGATTCALQCYNRLIHGSCINQICVPPKEKPVPDFDPVKPDCRDAIDPPMDF